MTTVTHSKQCASVALLLAAVMTVTRSHHFGSAVHLPDASLAVFFLAGCYLASSVFLPAFLALAGVIDYVVTSWDGVSDWCMTPAYVFLVPTYASLWWAGRWYARRHHETGRSVLSLALALFVGANVAFVISNGSFYLFSGYFEEKSLGSYVSDVAPYYAPYIGYAFVYVAVAAVLHVCVAAMGARKPEQAAQQGGL